MSSASIVEIYPFARHLSHMIENAKGELVQLLAATRIRTVAISPSNTMARSFGVGTHLSSADDFANWCKSRMKPYYQCRMPAQPSCKIVCDVNAWHATCGRAGRKQPCLSDGPQTFLFKTVHQLRFGHRLLSTLPPRLIGDQSACMDKACA